MRLVLDMQGENGGVEGNADAVLVAEEFILAYAMYLQKNATYGGAWRQQGWMGNLGRILSKVSRMRKMLWGDISVSSIDESVDDTTLDLINLAIFFRINRRNGNKWGVWWGEPR